MTRLLALVLLCGCAGAHVESVERVFPPRPAAESDDAPPIVGIRREFRGTRLDALEFSGTVEFQAPNRFRETRRFEAIGEEHTASFDGLVYARESDGAKVELRGTDARAVFDRCLEEALITRQYEHEPSLAVRELEGLSEFEGRPARAFEVAHGSSGFSRILFFATDTGSLIAMEGSRWNGGTVPVRTVLRFSEPRTFSGKELPTRVEIVEDGRSIETIRYEAIVVETAKPETQGS